jgi:serine/threonine protein kinase
MKEEAEIGWVVNQKWKVIEKISSGGFGSIYKAIDECTNEFVAVKTEKRANRNYLDREIEIYRTLEGVEGVPKLLWNGTVEALKESGTEGSSNVIVIEYLGSSLSELFFKNNKSFSLKTVLMVALQMVTRIEELHRNGIVHRDIKPGNFIMGIGERKIQVFIIDFGLSSYYLTPSKKHVKFNNGASFRGTHRYASINTHNNIEQSRRDDLEALGYVLIYFLKGKLPWQNIRVKKKDRKKVIGENKAKVSIKELTRGIPVVFEGYMEYVRGLEYEQDPDYNLIRNMFRECLNNNKYELDNNYDWMIKDNDETSSTTSVKNENTTPEYEKKKKA